MQRHAAQLEEEYTPGELNALFEAYLRIHNPEALSGRERDVRPHEEEMIERLRAQHAQREKGE